MTGSLQAIADMRSYACKIFDTSHCLMRAASSVFLGILAGALLAPFANKLYGFDDVTNLRCRTSSQYSIEYFKFYKSPATSQANQAMLMSLGFLGSTVKVEYNMQYSKRSLQMQAVTRGNPPYYYPLTAPIEAINPNYFLEMH